MSNMNDYYITQALVASGVLNEYDRILLVQSKMVLAIDSFYFHISECSNRVVLSYYEKENQKSYIFNKDYKPKSIRFFKPHLESEAEKNSTFLERVKKELGLEGCSDKRMIKELIKRGSDCEIKQFNLKTI